MIKSFKDGIYPFANERANLISVVLKNLQWNINLQIPLVRSLKAELAAFRGKNPVTAAAAISGEVIF